MTGRDNPGLLAARHLITRGTQINITYLGTEDMSARITAAQTVKESGFIPVPHLSARRLRSAAELTAHLDRLQEAGATERVFAVGGDPATPEGPYEDSLALIRSGLLADYGVRSVGIAGYPDGHPGISEDDLWKALDDKISILTEQGIGVEIITQFGFDTQPVVSWLRAVREHGIHVPVRVGIPGPAGVKRLLGYARRFGVASSAGIAKKYGFSLTNLLGTTGPDRFVADLAARLRTAALVPHQRT
ncbi:methylenetetrahydrofolate reductase, partial [Streptomyces carpinensis]